MIYLISLEQLIIILSAGSWKRVQQTEQREQIQKENKTIFQPAFAYISYVKRWLGRLHAREEGNQKSVNVRRDIKIKMTPFLFLSQNISTFRFYLCQGKYWRPIKNQDQVNAGVSLSINNFENYTETHSICFQLQTISYFILRWREGRGTEENMSSRVYNF